MRVTDALDVLNKSQGEHLYKVWVPSLKQNLAFRPLTVGQQKTLAKMAIEGEDQFYIGVIALIQSVCSEKLDLNVLTEVDKIAILAGIKHNNLVKPMAMELECNNEECKINFKHEVDLKKFIKDIAKVEFETYTETFPTNSGMIFEIELAYPSINKIVEYRKFCKFRRDEIEKNIKNQEKLEDKLFEFEQMIESEYITMFIKSVAIDGQKIEDFPIIKIGDRLDLFDKFPAEVLYSDSGVTGKVAEHFLGAMGQCAYKIECPECKNEELMSIENFFFS